MTRGVLCALVRGGGDGHRSIDRISCQARLRTVQQESEEKKHNIGDLAESRHKASLFS